MALSRTFLDGDLLSSSDINTHLVNQVPVAGAPYEASGTLTSVKDGSVDRVTTGNVVVRRAGSEVHVDGYIVINTAVASLAVGGAYAVGTFSHPPIYQWRGLISISATPGFLEAVVEGSGLMTIRNYGSAALSLPSGRLLGVSNIRYRTGAA